MSDLLARIKLDDKGLDAQLKNVSSKFSAAANGIARIAIPVAAIAGIARMVDGLAAIGERAIEAAGSLHDTAAQLGVTAERLQELRLIAQNAGVDVQGLDKSLGVLNRTLGQAALGQGEFEKVARAAGVELRNEQGQVRSTAEVWDMLTARIQSGALSQNQAIGLAAAAFGREGGKMVQVLRQTAEEQQRVIESARKFGAILSNEVVRSADEYGDQLDLIKKGTEALGTQSDLILAPLTIKWAQLKNEIAGAVVELARAARLVDDNTVLMERRLTNIKELLAEREAFLLKIDVDPASDLFIQNMTRELEALQAKLAEARRKEESASPADFSGGEDAIILSEEAEAAAKKAAEERARQAKEAADYELQLLADVEAERQRLIQLDTEHELELLTALEAEKERLRQQDAEAEFQLLTELAAERDRVIADEIFAFQQKEGLLTQARREGAEARMAFDKMEAGQQVATTIGALATITAAVAQHSKKAFELNKLAAIANAIVNTAQGATKALAQGGFAGIAMAAAVIAAGTAQIAAIRKTEFRGGGAGTTPSAVGTTPVINDQPVSGAGIGKTNNIRVEGIDPGALFTGRAIRELLERVQEAQKDGGRLVIA